MAVTEQQIRKIAGLARIDLEHGKTPQEAEAFLARLAGQMDAIVGYIDGISKADTTGVEPLYCPALHVAPPREDEAEKKRPTADMLQNAPERKDTFFSVPPVL